MTDATARSRSSSSAAAPPRPPAPPSGPRLDGAPSCSSASASACFHVGEVAPGLGEPAALGDRCRRPRARPGFPRCTGAPRSCATVRVDRALGRLVRLAGGALMPHGHGRYSLAQGKVRPLLLRHAAAAEAVGARQAPRRSPSSYGILDRRDLRSRARRRRTVPIAIRRRIPRWTPWRPRRRPGPQARPASALSRDWLRHRRRRPLLRLPRRGKAAAPSDIRVVAFAEELGIVGLAHPHPTSCSRGRRAAARLAYDALTRPDPPTRPNTRLLHRRHTLGGRAHVRPPTAGRCGGEGFIVQRARLCGRPLAAGGRHRLVPGPGVLDGRGHRARVRGGSGTRPRRA